MKKIITILYAAAVPFAVLSADESTNVDQKLGVASALFEKKIDDTHALKLRGRDHFAKKDYKSSLGDLDEIIHQNPRDANAYFNRGIVYFAMGNDKLAMESIETSFALKPDLMMQLKSKPELAKKIREIRENSQKINGQVRHKNGSVKAHKGSVATKVKH